jgi:hypothetical protein
MTAGMYTLDCCEQWSHVQRGRTHLWLLESPIARESSEDVSECSPKLVSKASKHVGGGEAHLVLDAPPVGAKEVVMARRSPTLGESTWSRPRGERIAPPSGRADEMTFA